MDWHLVHTKPRQERTALEHLERQGYSCYLPLLPCEQRRARSVIIAQEALFPRYLFIALEQSAEAKSRGPIRSTRGVSRLVSFGTHPARVDARLVEVLRQREAALKNEPVRLFSPGDRVSFSDGAFAGLEAIYQNPDGESRAMTLIELLSHPQRVRVDSAQLFRLA